MIGTLAFGTAPGADAFPSVDALRRECRALARKRALLAAASSLVPLPGVDLLTDVALLTRVIERINAHFGLDEAQVGRLTAAHQAAIYRLMAATGGTLAARLTRPGLIVVILRAIGIRLTAMEAVRFVPVAGQIIAAGIGYWSFNTLAQRHIRHCEALQQALAADSHAPSPFPS